MISLKKFRINIFCSALIAMLSSCATANAPVAAVTASNSECNDVAELIKYTGKSRFFNDQPQDFIKNSALFLALTKDDTIDKGIDRSIRTIKSSTINDKTPSSGIIKYRIVKGQQPEFSSAVFTIAQPCFVKPNDLLELAAKNISGTFDDIKMPPPDAYTLRSWTMPDSNADMVRTVEIIASDALLEIKIKREPAPTQP